MKSRNTLKMQMLRLIALGWFVPLTAIIVLFLLVVAGRIDAQSQRTITTSMEQAAQICILRLSDCIDASKDASYLPTLREVYNTYQRTGNEDRLYNDVTVFLAEQYKYNPNFDMTVLYFTDEPENLYFTGNNTGRGSVSRIRYFRDVAQKEAIEISKDLDTRTEFFASGSHVYMIRNVMNRDFENYAVLIMELNPERIFESLKSVWAYEGMSIYYNDECLWRESMSEDEDKDVAITTNKSIDGTFTYKVAYDAGAVNLEKRSVTVTFVLFIIFLIPLILVVLYFMQTRINTPISRLTEVSQQIAAGDYGVTVPQLEEEGEIADLTRNFNRMSEKLSEQFNKIFVEEIALRDANIHALQSQINPHFLNNTLEIINWEARIQGAEKVSSMIEALATMMSATMDRNRQSLIPLQEELEYVQAYLYIIQCRYQDQFSYSEEIDPALLSVKVPRLIIQPVIENAVEHNTAQETQRSVKMIIEGSATGDAVDMKIKIINPGEPTAEDMEKIRDLLTEDMDFRPLEERATRIGIRNVHRRLKILFGPESGLTIVPDGNGNTISTIFVKK